MTTARNPARGALRRHPSHDWGPHLGGRRWVQCHACRVLLHQDGAQRACPEAKQLLNLRRLFGGGI